ncbi:MAG: hypothetical protein GKR89_30900 [Candidatus Latescibacteria bacterium]|nr:hypothetical protein [Candidatus Latescibacterota bacterium]
MYWHRYYRAIFSFFALLVLVFSTNGWGQGYEPPIGIPAPSFGIEQRVETIYGAGYYTHYIDNTHPAATDADNPQGTLQRPRQTIPQRLLDLPPGSVVEIAGGPYRFAGPTSWTGQGTAEKPVFIRGSNPAQTPRIEQSRVEIGGRYLIVENLELYDDSRVSIHLGEPEYIALRNCQIHGPEGAATFGAAVRARGRDIVVYQNHIHHNWRHGDLDVHGVKPGLGAERIWVLDNHIHHNSGDAVQACHACDPAPRWVYIGRNIMHEDRENGVDLKFVQDIVISQNILYGYRDASTSDGSAIVLGSDGAPNRPWVVFNTIFASRNGIRNEAVDRAWIVGNTIYDIEGFAVGLEKRADDLYIVGNTIYDVGVGIDQFWREAFRLHIANNIFAQIRGGGVHLNIESQQVAQVSQMSHNLFWQDGDPVPIRWGTGGIRLLKTTADFNGFVGGPGNMVGDPLFAAAVHGDWRLQPNSPAIDAAAEHPAYGEFWQLHGIDIQRDMDGAIRPQQTDWDIGAFEYGDGGSTGVTEGVRVPAQLGLRSYPNPFNTAVSIEWTLASPTHCRVEILNVNGHLIAVLADDYYQAGAHQLAWSGKDKKDRPVASGPYFCQLQADGQLMARKILLLK